MVKSAFTFSLMLLLSLQCSFLCAHEARISGRVTDSHGKAVFAANVYLKHHANLHTASNEEGYFQLSFPEDYLSHDSLVVSFIGFTSQNLALPALVKDDTLQIVLQEDWRALDAVVLAANPELSEEFSLEKLEKLEIYLSPVAAGDPLNALTVLPAATNTAESANPAFRGSEAHASQVVLNGINISNPVRNTQMSGMGNFSLFNTELIQHLSVYAGNPPLHYGNSLAGLVDIKSTRQVEKSQTQLALSMANVGVLRSQRLGHDAFVQVYGNYQFSKPYLYLNDYQDMLQAFSSRDLGMNAHGQWGKSMLNYYVYFINEDYQGKEYYQQKMQSSEAWKRRAFGVFNWHYAHERFYLELNAGHDHSHGRMHLSDIDAYMTEAHYQLNGKLKYFLNDALYLQAGYSDEYVQLDYRHQEKRHSWQDTCLHYRLPEIFAYLRWKKEDVSAGIGSRYRLNRMESKQAQQSPRHALQAHLRYQLNDENSLQASAGQYYAYLCHSAGEGLVQLQTSRQYALEYDAIYGHTHLTAACYHKQEQAALYFDGREDWQACQRSISGLELSWEQEWDALKMSASYNYLHSRITWKGKDYPAANDLPYWIKTQLSYTNAQFFTIACTAQFRAGLRYTPVKEGFWMEETQAFVPVYGQLNECRLSDYQRVDLSLNKVFMFETGSMLVAFASLNNIFNHHNQAAVLYQGDYSAQIASLPMQLYSIYFGLQWSF